TDDPRSTRMRCSRQSPPNTPGADQARIMRAVPSAENAWPVRNGGSAYECDKIVRSRRFEKTSSRRADRPTVATARRSSAAGLPVKQELPLDPSDDRRDA